MVSNTRYYPKGYIGSEDAVLRIAKARHPDRWRPELLHEKEAEIYQGLEGPVKIYNAAALEGLLREQIPQADLKANGDIAERLYDFNYAICDLRIALHAGDLVAEFCDERGKFDWIRPAGWGGDEALWALFTGIVTLEDGFVRLILFKIDSIDKFTKQPDVRIKGPTYSLADMQRGFEEWRKKCHPKIPSLTEDYEHMNRKFGASRDLVEKVRESVPKLKRGRPRKSTK
jgi:hypothetical protein